MKNEKQIEKGFHIYPKIYKMYVGEKEIIEETEKDFLHRVEGSGYFKKGTAIKSMKAIGYLRTPWTFYSFSKSYLQNLLKF